MNYCVLGRSAGNFVRCLGDNQPVYLVATATSAAGWYRVLVAECNAERLHWHVAAAD